MVKCKSYILATLAFAAMAGLVWWQLQVLQESRQLREQAFIMQSREKLDKMVGNMLLHNISFRKHQIDSLMKHPKYQTWIAHTVDSFLLAELGEENLYWAITLSEKDSLVYSPAPEAFHRAIARSEAKSCISCFMLMTFEGYPGEVAIQQDVSTLAATKGDIPVEASNNKFFSLLKPPPPLISARDYVALWLIGIICLVFGTTLWLNYRQKQLIEQKNEFVNHLSHQFKTPLASVRLGTKMLLDTTAEPKAKEMLGRIYQESNRLDRHVQTVVHWIKSGIQGFTLSTEKLEANSFCKEAIRQASPLLQSGQVAVIFNSSVANHYIQADAEHLTLVFYNLWDNAIKHNPLPITLTISVEKQEHYIAISHRDNGQGYNPKAFNAGLGLSYIQKIMKAHNGKLLVDSGIGQGTTVTLLLPAA